MVCGVDCVVYETSYDIQGYISMYVDLSTSSAEHFSQVPGPRPTNDISIEFEIR